MVEVSSFANDPWVGFRTRHPDFDYGFRRGIETSKFLARDERDFEEMKKRQKEFENALGRIITNENSRKTLEDAMVAKLSSTESKNYGEHKLPTGAALLGYMLGLAAPLLGKEAVEHMIRPANMLKNAPEDALTYITEQIVAATHPPMSVVSPAEGRDSKLVILSRLRLKGTLRSLPEIAGILRSLPEIAGILSKEIEDVMEQHRKNMKDIRIKAILARDTRKMLQEMHDHLIKGRHKEAEERIVKHMRERAERNLPISSEIEILRDMLKRGEVNDAIRRVYHLGINAALTEQNMEYKKMTAAPNMEELARRLKDAVGRTDLVDIGKAIDLSDTKKISHWLEMDEDVLRKLEDIFDKRRYHAGHLMNIHMALADPLARHVLSTAIKRNDQELVEKIVKMMAENPNEFRKTLQTITTDDSLKAPQ